MSSKHALHICQLFIQLSIQFDDSWLIMLYLKMNTKTIANKILHFQYITHLYNVIDKAVENK